MLWTYLAFAFDPTIVNAQKLVDWEAITSTYDQNTLSIASLSALIIDLGHQGLKCLIVMESSTLLR
jgi:hypothetical protein